MKKPIFWCDKNGNSYSTYPPTTYLTFAYWIYMVPQYKPKNILILGFGQGTVAGLIRLIWGKVPITGVDIEPSENMYGVNLIQADAREYIKTCPKFDCIIVDLFYRKDNEPCEFITDKNFVDNLTRIGNYLIINTLHKKDMSAYRHLKCMGVNKPSGSAELVYYYLVAKPIPNLHPYK